MFHRIRRRFTYANVVMTIAFVFAMTGGAYAAKHYLITSTKQISPKVLKQLKGTRGPAGPEGKQGPAGPAGANGKDGINGKDGVNGKDGLNGKDGVNGTNGESVTIAQLQKGDPNCAEGGAEFSNKTGTGYACNGGAGSGGAYPECLPSGKTEEGQWALNEAPVTVENLGKNKYTPISFTLPLCKGVAVAPHFVSIAEQGQNKLPAGCKGNHAEPEAEPGNLCVFAQEEEDFAFASFLSAETSGPEVKGSGVLITLKTTADEPEGKARALGDWVVTAP